LNDAGSRYRSALAGAFPRGRNAFVLLLLVIGSSACSLRSLEYLREVEGAPVESAGAGGTHAGGGGQAGSLVMGDLQGGRHGALAGMAGAAMGGTGAVTGGASSGGAGSGGTTAGSGGDFGGSGSTAGGGSGAAGGMGGAPEGGTSGAAAGAAGSTGGDGGSAGATGTGCVTGEPCPLENGAAYQLIPGHNRSACVDVLTRSFREGARAIQFTNHEQSNQVFWVEARGDGAFSFRSANSGKCLEVANASTEADAPIRQATCTGAAHQRWRPVPASDGLFRLEAEHSGLVLDVDGPASDDNGTFVVQNPARDLMDTMWELRKATDGAFVALRESNETERRVRHSGAAVSVATAAGVEAEWKVMIGLSDASCVSFQARDESGCFLRLADGGAVCEPQQAGEAFAADATFCFIEPFDGDDAAFRSIEPVSRPGEYLLRDGDRVVSAPFADTTAFRNAASWYVHEPN
jgi:hypothetical protein